MYTRQSWNFRSHIVSASCISMWHHRPMHASHRLMHACTACIAPWHHRPMHAYTAWAPLFWFCLRYTFLQLLWASTDYRDLCLSSSVARLYWAKFRGKIYHLTVQFWCLLAAKSDKLVQTLPTCTKNYNHRYLRKVACSRHISLHKIRFRNSTSCRHIDKIKQTGQDSEQSTKTSQAGWVNEPY